jgi:hypothetical protein
MHLNVHFEDLSQCDIEMCKDLIFQSEKQHWNIIRYIEFIMVCP